MASAAEPQHVRQTGWATFWLVLAIGLVLRVALLPIPNTDNDFYFHVWSRMITVDGFHQIYDVFDPRGLPLQECQYPPGYLYVLRGVGEVYRRFFSPRFDESSIELLALLRIPTVLADLALALILATCLRRAWGFRVARAGFAAYYLSPAWILDSTIVTQIDTVQALLMTLTVLALGSGRAITAMALLALAALTKPQSVILAPLTMVLVYRMGGLRSLLWGALAMAAVFVALSLPFLVNDRAFELWRTLAASVGVNPYLSANAYNLWWLVTGGNGMQSDTTSLIGPMTPRHLGLLLFAAAAALGLWRLGRRMDRFSLLLVATWTCFTFYMLPTEMTERYLLPALPFALLLAPYGRRWSVLFAVLIVTASVNLYLVFPLIAVTPWDAWQLPHSNYYYYLHPKRGPAPSMLLPAEAVTKVISLFVAAVHLLILVWLAVEIAYGRRQPTSSLGKGANPGSDGAR